MRARKSCSRDREKNAVITPLRHQGEVRLLHLGEDAFRLQASFVRGLIEHAQVEVLDCEYVNGVLAAFHFLHITGGEKAAMELLKRRKHDR